MLSKAATVRASKASTMCVRWKSATSFANYFRDDPVLDVFDKVRPASLQDLTSYTPRRYPLRHVSHPTPKHQPTDDFFSECVERGRQFEESTMKTIRKLIPNHYDVGVTTRDAALSTRNYAITLQLLRQRKVDCILHGLVRNEDNQTYGAPDLIVLGRSLHLLGAQPCPDHLRNTYFAVDIKSSHVHLTAEGQVANDPLTLGYKAQMLVYALAIKNMTRDTSTTLHAYLLGSAYSRGTEPEKIATYKTLGFIDFRASVNSEMLDKLTDAIRWLNEVEVNLDRMNLDQPNRPELFPNMKNRYSKHFTTLKKQYASHVDEITQMWQCGVAERRRAHESGVKRLRDVRRAAVVGRSPDSKVGGVLDRMLSTNGAADAPAITIPDENNRFGWRFNRAYEWYLDLECVDNIIYMIGLVVDGEYRVLRAPTLDADGEKRLLLDLISMHPGFATFVVHWGAIEPRTIMNKMADYGIAGWEQFDDLTEWCDLLEVFRYADAPVIVKGARGFGLKEVSRALACSGALASRFETTEVSGGLESLAVARAAYAGTPGLFDELVRYNEADCRSLHDVLHLMRSVK